MIKRSRQVIIRQLLFCMFFSCTFPLFANVGVFRGNGQTPILSSTAQIQMVEEEITIYPVRGNYPTDDSCAYPDQMRFVCRFLLRNLTDQKVTVPVGFPIDFQVFRADEKRIKEANQVHHVVAFGFVAGTKEQTFPVRFCFEDKDKKFRNLFLWDMTFQPGEEIELHISYQTGGYYGLASTTIDSIGANTIQMPEKFSFLNDIVMGLGQFYQYVTVTGGCWSGKIEKAIFRFHPFLFEEWLVRRGACEMTSEQKVEKKPYMKQLMTARPVRVWNPHFDQWKHINPTRKKNRQYLELTYAPFEPKTGKDNLLFGYVFPAIPVTVSDFEVYAASKKLSTPAQRKLLADFILEFYGIPTGNEELLPALKTQCWYPVKKSNLVPSIDPELKAHLEDISNAGK